MAFHHQGEQARNGARPQGSRGSQGAGLFCICLAAASGGSQTGTPGARSQGSPGRSVPCCEGPTCRILARRERSGATEADVVVAIVRCVPVAVGRPDVVRVIVPRAAPQDAPARAPTHYQSCRTIWQIALHLVGFLQPTAQQLADLRQRGGGVLVLALAGQLARMAQPHVQAQLV